MNLSDLDKNGYVNQYLFHKRHCSDQKLMSIELFIKDVTLIEDVLGFQKWLDEKISEILSNDADMLKTKTTKK